MSVKIELGSGFHGIPDHFHVDAVAGGNVDRVSDIRDLSWIPDAAVDELYSAHAVEHISYTEIARVLQEWHRVLKLGGKLTIKMPDLDFLCHAHVSGIYAAEETMICMFGGFSDYPNGPDGWEKISGNPNWARGTMQDGKVANPGRYTEWGAHKALYNFNTFKVRLEDVGFKDVVRVDENDWELHVVAFK